MGILERLKARRPVPTEPLRWLEFDASEAPEHPTVVDDIFARRLDGITVPGVFTPDEARRAVEVLDRHRGEATGTMFGSLLPITLAHLKYVSDDPHDRTPYLDAVDHAAPILAEAFGRPPEARIAEVIGAMTGGLPVSVPREGGRPYSAGNVRWYDAGSCGLPAHVGNEFELHDHPAFEHLRATTTTRNHLSWFVVLQPPEEGGALSVFDLLFEDDAPGGSTWGEDGRDDSAFDATPARRISPGAGGLILFGGGWRWHRVDRIAGTIPRITYGGFAGRSVDGKVLNLWF